MTLAVPSTARRLNPSSTWTERVRTTESPLRPERESYKARWGRRWTTAFGRWSRTGSSWGTARCSSSSAINPGIRFLFPHKKMLLFLISFDFVQYREFNCILKRTAWTVFPHKKTEYRNCISISLWWFVQIVNLHYMLSKSVVKSRPTVLWCYKEKLELSRSALAALIISPAI